MQDKKIFYAPAKLNIFLKVLGKRKDGYHNIYTAVTFINLFDKVEIQEKKETKVSYKGFFKPKKNKYNDCIILKTLNYLKLQNVDFNIEVTKNIPVQGGLGSASTNAATLINGLFDMKYIKKIVPNKYIELGADIPSFLLKKNCILNGIGEISNLYSFPKFYFLLVKPNFGHSTKNMYSKLKIKTNSSYKNLSLVKFTSNDIDIGNDFEKIVFKENLFFKDMFDFLKSMEKVIFTRMTGTGSCFYAAFEKKDYALKAEEFFKSRFKDIWTYVCENNTINS